MSKRVKINFETINKGRYEIIPPEKVAESRERIKQNMKTFLKKMSKEEIQHWIDRWNRLKPLPKRDMVIKIWGGKPNNTNENEN